MVSLFSSYFKRTVASQMQITWRNGYSFVIMGADILNAELWENFQARSN